MVTSATVFLEQMASKYIWWKTPEAALRYPDRLMAQIMDMGTFGDIQALVLVIGEDRLTDVLRHADPGWF
ncbi:MAG TPA: hypothetical protein VMV40_09845 [Acidiferrobacter sp.]|nr:hypothetical protein [Acidiferrobacter sp.]